ncbi:MAG: hypothetical protein K5739_12920 [Lachnospiraceae bacterium]|nr:hypothetical protein [Lachnospiraceae bacterium]
MKNNNISNKLDSIEKIQKTNFESIEYNNNKNDVSENSQTSICDILCLSLIIMTIICGIISNVLSIISKKYYVTIENKILDFFSIRNVFILGLLASISSILNSKRSKTKIAKKCKEISYYFLATIAGILTIALCFMLLFNI